MDEEVIYLLNRFPKQKKLLVDSYSNNEEFRSMCQAYYNSAISLEKSERNLMKGSKSRQEYELAYLDLESAIARSLKSFKEAGKGAEKS